MNQLTLKLGHSYVTDVQSWGDYYGDYIDIQLIPNIGGEQIWIYYHNAHGSTYAK